MVIWNDGNPCRLSYAGLCAILCSPAVALLLAVGLVYGGIIR